MASLTIGLCYHLQGQKHMFLGQNIYRKGLSIPDLTFRVSNSVVLLIMEK